MSEKGLLKVCGSEQNKKWGNGGVVGYGNERQGVVEGVVLA